MSEAKTNDSNKSQQQKLLLPSSGFPPSSPEDDSKIKGKYRFEVAVLSLATMVFAVCVLQALATCEFFFVRLGVLPVALFLTFFGYEWVTYFSDALTRRKRAYFDVRNLLETYQPRRNTDLARQFKPDPPTPSVSNQPTKGTSLPEEDVSGDNKGGNAALKKDFASWRNQHYANEYANAMTAGQGQVSLYEPIPGEIVGNDVSTANSTNSNENNNLVIPADSIEQMKGLLEEKKNNMEKATKEGSKELTKEMANNKEEAKQPTTTTNIQDQKKQESNNEHISSPNIPNK